MDGKFEALEVAVELAGGLRPLLGAVVRRDRDLENQMRRSAASVVLNLAEGAERRGRDRLQHYRIAAGSAAEVGAAPRLARVWGYVEASACRAPEALLTRVQQMLWKLTHGPG